MTRIARTFRRTLSPVALAAALALAGTGAGCGDELGNFIEGSLGEFYDLSCESVRARLYSSELAIEYVNVTQEVPVRVTVRRSLTDPPGPATVDLESFGDITGVSQGADIPPFVSGTLYLRHYSRGAGSRVAGDFEAIFEAGDDQVTLDGEFETTLTVVE